MKKLIVVMAACVIAAVVWGQPALYRVQANVKASLTFPDGDEIKSVEYVRGDTDIQPVELNRSDGLVSFDITPHMLTDGSTILVFNRPPGKHLSDRTPPTFERIVIDRRPVHERPTLMLPYVPGEVDMTISDPSGISSRGLQVAVDGSRAEADTLAVERFDLGRRWEITYQPAAPETIQNVTVTATDRSLLENTSRFSLVIERAFERLSGDYSGGEAVRLTQDTAFLAKHVELAAGEYEVELIASGPSSGANSLWIEIDGKQQPDPVHLPVQELGVASRQVEIDPQRLPRFTIPEDGEHTLVFTLREGPDPTVDCVRILQDGRQIAAYEAEDMLPAFPKP
ncbi:MAG: hypothetical protein ACLFWB_09920 [Armatimonadota bacterium]